MSAPNPGEFESQVSTCGDPFDIFWSFGTGESSFACSGPVIAFVGVLLLFIWLISVLSPVGIFDLADSVAEKITSMVFLLLSIGVIYFGATEWTNQTHRERDAEAAEHVEYEKRVSEWLLGGYSITVPDTAIAPLLNGKLLVVDYDGAEIQITIVPRADGDLAVRHEDGTMLVGR